MKAKSMEKFMRNSHYSVDVGIFVNSKPKVNISYVEGEVSYIRQMWSFPLYLYFLATKIEIRELIRAKFTKREREKTEKFLQRVKGWLMKASVHFSGLTKTMTRMKMYL